MRQSRRSVLGIFAAGLSTLSGCSAMQDIAEEAAEETRTPRKTRTPIENRGVDEGAFPTPQKTGSETTFEFEDDVDSILTTEKSTPDIDDQIEGQLPDETVPIYTIDDKVTVEAGANVHWNLDLLSSVDSDRELVTIEYEGIVRDGPAVDFFLLESAEYTSYINGENFLTISAASALDTQFSERTAVVDALKDYMFVVDNSSAAAAEPVFDETAEVDIELTVS